MVVISVCGNFEREELCIGILMDPGPCLPPQAIFQRARALSTFGSPVPTFDKEVHLCLPLARAFDLPLPFWFHTGNDTGPTGTRDSGGHVLQCKPMIALLRYRLRDREPRPMRFGSLLISRSASTMRSIPMRRSLSPSSRSSQRIPRALPSFPR